MIKLAKSGYFNIGWIVMLLCCLAGCKPPGNDSTPSVTTAVVSKISAGSLVTGGEVVDEGGSPVTLRGVCWSLTKNPTNAFKDSLTTDGAGSGKFVSTVAKLNAGTTYNLRAYATSSIGTSYGNLQTAITLATIPTISTTAVIAVTDKIINSGGNVTSDGGSPVSARGVCWGTSINPTTANNFTSDSLGTGIFNSSVTKILPDSVYYLRAYATNSIGTAYGNTRSFTLKGLIVLDNDGNYYHFVAIGSQVWMVENLKTTLLNDGSSIQLQEDNTKWNNLTSSGYCWYNNDFLANKATNGALYNWYSVSTGKLCPTGWHVPTDVDWTTLTTHLGGELAAGGMLKEKSLDYWKVPNTGATNETLFTALPGGYRMESGESINSGNYGYWWSSTSVNTTVAYCRYMYYGSKAVTRSFVSKQYGLSVRCIKN